MTTPIFDILGFGAVAVDDLLYVDEYPPAESKVRVRHRLRQCGGLTGTALVAASRLGALCAYVGLLGNDELSIYVTDCFAREGVDTSHCARRAGAKPAQSTIIVDEHHKTRTIFASLAGDIGADVELPSRELISSARVILVDHHGLEGTIRAQRIARENGVAIVADFERKAEGNFLDLLALVDHLVISDRFAVELTGKTKPEQATAALWTAKRRAVVVTCGSAGSWLLTDDYKKPVHCPARAVKVLDTTGCGDVFHGAYSAALARGKSPAECVEFASAAAALKATQRGGQTGCPTLQQVEEFLRRAE
ncbi:MAG: PfkB family carbohydrate kinase [Thermoguttaceae bacterium]|jgi:sugar/nucleoside kinase (ribokinase family)